MNKKRKNKLKYYSSAVNYQLAAKKDELQVMYFHFNDGKCFLTIFAN